MSKEKYWSRRAAQKIFDFMEEAEAAADKIGKVYYQASRYLSLSAEDIFERYQTKHNLTEKEARRLIGELQGNVSFGSMLDEYKNSTLDTDKNEVLARLEAPAYKARIQRLENLQDQIDHVMQEVYQQEKEYHTERYTQLATDAYYRGIYDVQSRTGLAFEFTHVDPKVAYQVINSRWIGDNYSKRIWKRTEELAETLKQELLVNMLTGRTERDAAQVIAERFSQSAFNARRLIRTETCYISNEMEARSYEECGIEDYIFVAVLDLRTSKDCRAMDRKRIKVKDRKPGENYPPLHPWCRSTTIADISDEELAKLERRARDPVTGKTMMIPANMSYEEWYNEYVKGKPEAEAAEKAIKDRSADRRQYKKYREILGDSIPESFADFQEMKYNKVENYNLTKLAYKRQNDLLNHPEKRLPNAETAILPEGKFTRYFFNPDNPKGYAKGKVFTDRLGYSIDNWNLLQKEIRENAHRYPSVAKGDEGYGERYEQKMILYGLKDKPANVIVAWIDRGSGETSLTSAYIKEVK